MEWCEICKKSVITDHTINTAGEFITSCIFCHNEISREKITVDIRKRIGNPYERLLESLEKLSKAQAMIRDNTKAISETGTKLQKTMEDLQKKLKNFGKRNPD